MTKLLGSLVLWSIVLLGGAAATEMLASAPSITRQPESHSRVVGESHAGFWVEASGTPPITYQWQKDSKDLPGATQSFLSIPSPQLSDAGKYRVLVSNPNGSELSQEAVLVVSLPPPPTVSSPWGADLVEGTSYHTWVSADGYGVMTYQWYKDGVPLSGKTEYQLQIPSAQVTDSGSYHATVSNAGGTTTSAKAELIVRAVTIPGFESQPQSVTVEEGEMLELAASAISNGSISYQWYKDDVPQDAKSNTYRVRAEQSHAGVYRLLATSEAGSTWSLPATVVVKPQRPPISGRIIGAADTHIGHQISLRAEAWGTSGISSYQWFHNGEAIPGATANPLSVSVKSADSFGEYYVRMSNRSGMVDSPVVLIRPSRSPWPTFRWLQVTERAEILYFLIPEPARIARYDLSARRWLEDLLLPRTPTALAVGENHLFVAFGKSLSRFNKDLGGELAWATTPTPIHTLVVHGQAVFALRQDRSTYSTDISSYALSSPINIAEKRISGMWEGFVFCPNTGRIYASSYGHAQRMLSADLDTDGSVRAGPETGTPGGYIGGERAFLVGNGTRVIEENGAVYDGDAVPQDLPLGRSIQYIIDDNAGSYLAVRGRRLVRLDSTYREHATLTVQGFPEHMALRDGSVFLFTQPSSQSQQPQVQVVAATALASPMKASIIDPVGHAFFPGQVNLDSEGVVYIHSPADRNIFRWCTQTNRFLPAIPLASRASFVAYSRETHSLYLDHEYSQIQRIPLDGPVIQETPFHATSRINDLVTGGSLVAFGQESDYGTTLVMVATDGSTVATRSWYNRGTVHVWPERGQNIYGISTSSQSSPVRAIPLGPNMEPGTAFESSQSVPVTGRSLLQVNEDGTEILTDSGLLFSGKDLVYLGAVANDVVDAVWSHLGIHTIRRTPDGTEVQTWSGPSRLLRESRRIPGTPVRLLALPEDRLLVVTSVGGKLLFAKLANSTLTSLLSSDGSTTRSPTTADLDFDGSNDLLWTNRTTGEVAAWMLRGGAYLGSTTTLETLDAGDRIEALADFNGDDQTDFLCRNSVTGKVWIQLYSVSGKRGDRINLPSVAREWQVAAAADLNADGNPDVIWQNTVNGDRAFWMMNGTAFSGTAFSITSIAPEWVIVGVVDLTGDGKPDILWHNRTTRAMAAWAMDGHLYAGAFVINGLPEDCDIVQVADYNGDGHPDVICQDPTSGAVTIRYMVSGQFTGATSSLGAVGEPWLAGTSYRGEANVPVAPRITPHGPDFNGDGHVDLLWQNQLNGAVAAWLLENGVYAGAMNLPTLAANHRIVGSADFNGDGKADLLRFNAATGVPSIDLLSNGTSTGTTTLPAVSATWNVVGTGDFNGDDKPDIIWESANTGEHAAWLMNGASFASAVVLPTIDPTWAMLGAADFNGDGSPDLLWRNTANGNVAVWLMNGLTYAGAANLPSAGLEWDIAEVADFDADGKVDIMWQNPTKGECGIWLMNGTNYLTAVMLPSAGTEWRAGTCVPQTN